MTSINMLEKLLAAPPVENEHLEFKVAPAGYSHDNLFKYCAAIANEGGGHLVLGVTGNLPRKVVGTKAFNSPKKLDEIKLEIVETFGIRVNVREVSHPHGRVLVFVIPPHPVGKPLRHKGRYLMCCGESLAPMTEDRLVEILNQGAEDWLSQAAKENVSGGDVVNLLNTQIYFKLLNKSYPSQQREVLQSLQQEEFIRKSARKWTITRLGAIVLAKNLREFSIILARKAPRFILYDGNGKTHTKIDKEYETGYAVSFDDLVDFAHEFAPLNYIEEVVIRTRRDMFPKLALRELIANALIHQDFSIRGASVMIEMYTNRVDISSPGKPMVNVKRFIEGYQARNARLANIMRRFGICEEKGSGIDRVLEKVENHHLPAPTFISRSGDIRTYATLYPQQDFSEMHMNDRIRACYQHCCLRYLKNSDAPMTNATLRQRFALPDSKMAMVSQIIAATKEEGLIKSRDGRESTSSRYRSYVPHWG